MLFLPTVSGALFALASLSSASAIGVDRAGLSSRQDMAGNALADALMSPAKDRRALTTQTTTRTAITTRTLTRTATATVTNISTLLSTITQKTTTTITRTTRTTTSLTKTVFSTTCGVTSAVTTSASSASSSPTQALSNPDFTGGSYSTPPTGWSMEGAVSFLDCSTPDQAINNPDCFDQQSAPYFMALCTDDDEVHAPEASFSQTVNSLAVGRSYNFTLSAGYDNTANTCVVTYSLDGTAFSQFAPGNTYDAGSNQTSYNTHGPVSVTPTANTQTLKVSMNCPNAGDNGGVAYWQAPSLIGPL